MKKLFIYSSFTVVMLFLLVSCTKDLTSLNSNEKKPASVDPAALFAYAEKRMADAVTSTSVNLNVFRLYAQQWAQTTYIDESQYDLTTRAIPGTFWTLIYTDVLKNLALAKESVTADTELDAAGKANRLAQIDIIAIYAYSVLVNIYGSIPYSEALDIDNLFPKYEDGQTIYTDLLKRLDVSLAALSVSGDSFGSSDLIYKGDITLWKKFGNSLKLRFGVLLADFAPATAKTVVEQAAPNVFTAAADNALFPYSTVTPNTNPLWESLVQSGRKDFVGASTIIDVLNDLSDPRRQFYFSTVDGDFIGGDYGESNEYASFSHPGALLERKDLKGVFIDYTEVEFLLAEAVERGFSVTGTAATHYTNAITSSIVYWGGTAEDAAEYVAQPEVAYATAVGDYKEKIGVQKWLALYNRGLEAWTEWRRLDYPHLEAPADAISDIPLRFTYPVDEQNLNTEQYNKAVTAMGGTDLVSVHIFWDIF
jgi:hypothetical protein